ncbi:MAG: tRNA pseudouridine(38-40) synthase TruA [Bacteroidales bacterium]|nr:tRNA pseudouridine(38-40) synthase TruA [Bacteroidales bacterium]
MARYFTQLSFDGSNYHGWQTQPNAQTIQETLEKAFGLLLKENVSIVGAGRTDTGVHASFFIAHFDSRRGDIETDQQLLFRLNSFLPDDIAIHSIRKVEDHMHARYSAKYRQYSYRICNTKPVFNRKYCYYYFGKLDLDLMNSACSILREYTDFTSFSKLHTDVKNNNCMIHDAKWTAYAEGWEFDIRADRFLRNMVRSIVGTMLEIGKHKLSLEAFREIIESRDRNNAGMSAEARGLFLVDIGY